MAVVALWLAAEFAALPFARAKLSLLAGGRGTLCDCVALLDATLLAPPGRGTLFAGVWLPAEPRSAPPAAGVLCAPLFAPLTPLCAAFADVPTFEALCVPEFVLELLCAVADWALLKLAARAGGVARVTTERLADAAEGTLLRGVCPPSTEDLVGLTLAELSV